MWQLVCLALLQIGQLVDDQVVQLVEKFLHHYLIIWNMM